MAFIKIIPPGQGDEYLEEIYRTVTGPKGQVDQVLQVHSLRPHGLKGHMALYKAALHHNGNDVPTWFLEAVGVLVSRLNDCDYCDIHHSTGMRRLHRNKPLPFEEYDRALAEKQPGEPFTLAEQAALAYASKLTTFPGEIEQADIDLLRKAGWSDGEILEINQAAAYFAYANRTVTGLGVSTEGETLGLSPGEGDGWQHG